MYPTTPTALAALNDAGWTEIENYRVGTFAARGGTLAVLTTAPDGGDWTTITAVTLRPMTEDQTPEWEKAHPGFAPFILVGAKTGDLIPGHTVVRGEDGAMRVFWNPQPLDAFEGDGPEDNTQDGPEDNTQDNTEHGTQPMGEGERLSAAMAEPGSYHQAQHTMTTMKAYMAAGFTRDEAFELVLVVWSALNQHQADHCIQGTECPMERPQADTDGEG